MNKNFKYSNRRLRYFIQEKRRKNYYYSLDSYDWYTLLFIIKIRNIDFTSDYGYNIITEYGERIYPQEIKKGLLKIDCETDEDYGTYNYYFYRRINHKNSFPVYKEKLYLGKNSFRFRYDPVPGIHSSRGYWKYRRSNRNINYWASMVDLPNILKSGRTKFQCEVLWEDEDYKSLYASKSWKKQKKKRQWM